MSLISKQIDDLRDYAKSRNGELAKIINDAADTIELLSEKLSARNMECSSAHYHDGWIPCSETEEAPEYEVIACNADGEEMLGYLSTDGVDWECDSAYELMVDVVAWMEKPKPWGGKEN